MSATPAVTGRGALFSVVVAALGYFVDLYDIVIFGVLRVASLAELGITGADATAWGVHLFNLQMVGMLAGGLAWGVIGDRWGRRFALLATIALYSCANIANAFVTDVEQYAVLRFVAGFGLAGELGAGITLVSELLPSRLRGYGTTLISFLGLCGALLAALVGKHLDWRTAYLVGGAMGLLVLALRVWGLRESALFEQQKAAALRPGAAGHGGDLRLLVRNRATLGRFLAVVAVGVPIWYVSALFVNFAPEYGVQLGLSGPLLVADVLAWQATGLAIGSAVSGLASEWLRSRRRVIALCFAAMAVLTFVLLRLDGASPSTYARLMFVMGLFQGYWTAFLAMGAEQFGTNIRATVSTSVPNFVRAMTVPVNYAVLALAPALGFISATLALGVLVFAVAAYALWRLPETWGRPLDFREG